jgi:two-component system CheB/CheR fusion protein
MQSTEPDYIIAIGASAGGLEEINTFFDHTPLDGVAYVIVQHLSAEFKSRMVEILARHSKLKIEEAKEGTEVQTNHVYLIPNNNYMTIKNGRLYLTDKENISGPHLTINKFFNSLAVNCGKKAIGIILSGLGSDGTEGIKEIKRAGGMVMVRNPETSEFSSMPAHAIITGMVDFVLEPELMPSAIEDFVKYAGKSEIESQDDEKSLIAIINLIKEKMPLDFSDYKQSTILRRTNRRAVHGNFTSIEKYLQHLKITPKEVEALAQDFLISVTSFFRDQEAFKYIQNKILPDILKNLVEGEELKFWVAGCATGEEVYSLAILINEQLKDNFADTIVKIFATDIDSVALVHAGKGVYPESIEKDVSQERLDKYFIKKGNNYQVKPELRRMVIFAQHDLVKNPPYCNMHFISCRNLLIYMTPVLQKKIFSMLHFGLKMNGYLFLGSSENPLSIMQNLEIVHKKWKIYKNIKAKRLVSFDTFTLPELLDIKPTPSRIYQETSKNLSSVVIEQISAAIAKEMDCLIICVDENKQVIKSFGDTGKYLLQENFNSYLPELLPKALAVAFNTLINNVIKTNKKSSFNGIVIKQEKTTVSIGLTISPLLQKNTEQSLYMVIFKESTPSNKEQVNNLVFDEKIYHKEYTINLEQENKELKEKLYAAYERLDASNENMQSFNEELISANEEMQSTNEEMQSVNEELHTINTDYQLKNKELLETNDDLNNYFRSNINGQLFINNDLQLMKFSPEAVKQINLLESDIGRQISHISTNIKFESIIDDVKSVIKNGRVITKEIETNNGLWYQIMTMPYLQMADNKINGAIITFNDITTLKNTQNELDQKNKSLIRINEDLDHFIHAASHDLLAPLGNIETSISIMNMIALTDDKLLDFLNIINTSIRKFRVLITDIATIARIESDMATLVAVDIDDIINNVTWSLEGKITSSNAVITRDLEIKTILFSKKNLRSIVYNLVSNAIKFKGEAAPAIQIQTKREGKNVVLIVQDNGAGIPEKNIDKIFEMYGRLNQKVEGTGIGLYLAKKIVDASGGSMQVESTVGIGSKFIISFVENHENQDVFKTLN